LKRAAVVAQQHLLPRKVCRRRVWQPAVVFVRVHGERQRRKRKQERIRPHARHADTLDAIAGPELEPRRLRARPHRRDGDVVRKARQHEAGRHEPRAFIASRPEGQANRFFNVFATDVLAADVESQRPGSRRGCVLLLPRC